MLSLAKLLGLTGPLLFLDLETTGTSRENDRVLSVSIAQVSPTSAAPERRTMLINPERSIPPSSTAVHGITDDDVKEAPRFAQVARAILGRIRAAQVVAGYNVRGFDLPVLQHEFERAGIRDFDPEGVRVIDSKGIFFARESRNLEAAVAFYCGRVHTNAHTSEGDVEASAAVLLGQLERYTDLPHDVGLLADYSENRDDDALDLAGKIVWRDGAARLTFSDHAGLPLQDVDRGFLRWVLGKDFGSSTKAIVRAALDGHFPTGPRVTT